RRRGRTWTSPTWPSAPPTTSSRPARRATACACWSASCATSSPWPRRRARAATKPPSASTFLDGDDLDRLARDRRLLPLALAHQGAGQGRDVADAALGRIGLVLADDAPGLGAAVLALDGHRVAEAHLAVRRRL